MIVCELCGAPLSMEEGQKAVCTNCGMTYSLDRLRALLNQASSGEEIQSAPPPLSEETSQTDDFLIEDTAEWERTLLSYNGQASVVSIPEGVKSLGYIENPYGNVFFFPECIHKVILPEGLDCISSAFSDCENLEEITFPSSLTCIFDYFSGLSHLRSVIFQSPCNLYDECPSGLFKNCISLHEVRLPEQTKEFSHIPSSMFQGCVSLEEIVIPDGFTHIGELAFAGCTKLKKVTLPQHEIAIHPLAFQGCPYQPPQQWTQLKKFSVCPRCGGPFQGRGLHSPRCPKCGTLQKVKF